MYRCSDCGDVQARGEPQATLYKKDGKKIIGDKLCYNCYNRTEGKKVGE